MRWHALEALCLFALMLVDGHVVGRGWLCALAGWLERKGRWRSNLSARACCLGETGSTEGAACVCPFFDVSVVRYPSSYSYAATYETRSLTPVTGYEHGTSMFTTMDISSTISSGYKYAGGVLGPDGLIYFVPFNAHNIGILDASSSSFSTLDISSSISSSSKYNGGVLGPDGRIYFVPLNANNIGILNLANKNPSYEAGSCMPEAWSSLLSPHFNKF